MKTSYFSCTNFFTPDDVSLVLGRQPTHCQTIETTRNTIGVIVNRDQTEPVITCVLPGSPAESVRLQRGAVIWAVATEGVSTPEGALKALQRHMKEGKNLVITTDRGTVSVVPRRAAVQQCFWQVPGNVSSDIVQYRSQDEDVSIASVRHSSEPGSTEVAATFLDGWLVDITWTYRK
jgi:C-terminal processing protease CtpA/Prc